MKMSGRPAIITMSPASADGVSTRSRPLNVKIFVIFPVRGVPSGFLTVTVSPAFTTPSYTRAIARRPKKLSYARLKACKRSGFAAASGEDAAGTFSSTVSRSAVRSRAAPPFDGISSSERAATPSRPIAYTVVKSACSSVAPRSRKSSSTCSSARAGSAAGLSILLSTKIGFKPSSSDFLSTKRVCGIGPSCASTTKSTESIERSTRSTSDPKSAWPGVSTMLIFVPL